MRQQTAKILCAAGVGLAASLASTAFTTTTAEARECLAAPKGPAPAGSHWFYRTDHATKQNCWYVRAKSGASSPATAVASDTTPDDTAAASSGAPATSRSETAAADQAATPATAAKPKPAVAPPLRPSIANARAEAHTPEPAPMRDAAPQAASSQFPAPLPAATTAPEQTEAATPSPQPPSQTSPVDQRWADAHASDASAAATADASTKLRTAAQNAVIKGGTPANVAMTTAGSAATLIAALLAALALAGMIVGGIFKFSRREPVVRRDLNGRPDIWGAASKPAAPEIEAEPLTQDIDPAPPMQPVEPPSWIKAARQHQAPVEDSDEIEDLLARAQKRPAA